MSSLFAALRFRATLSLFLPLSAMLASSLPAAANPLFAAADRIAERDAGLTASACPPRAGVALAAREDGWKTIIEAPGGALYIVTDGFKLPCATLATCGTGGCMLRVTRLDGKRSKAVYSAFARGWTHEKASDGSAYMRLDLHGSRCGKTGAEDCFWKIDLATGTLRRLTR